MLQGISKIHITGLLLISIGILTPSKSFAESKLSTGIIKYQPKKDRKSIVGDLNCRGSTNVGALLEVWLPAFKEIYPSVKTSMDFKGSSDGIKSLMDGVATVGAASRPIKQKEIDAFKAIKGYTPTEIKVSLDALGIYVNRLNKLETITLEELDAIFSVERKRGYDGTIESWQKLTKKGDNNQSINIYLFDKNSGTRSFFRHQVMLKGSYDKSRVKSEEYTTTEQLLNALAKDENGIGFGSIGINNFKVKTLSLSKRANYPTYKPCKKEIKSGEYPLTRFFYIYLDVPPNQPIPTMFYEFCKFVLSYEGQKIVIRTGGLALSPQQIGTELSKIRRE
jgi:phosphate transport system substrate-binding protein